MIVVLSIVDATYSCTVRSAYSVLVTYVHTHNILLPCRCTGLIHFKKIQEPGQRWTFSKYCISTQFCRHTVLSTPHTLQYCIYCTVLRNNVLIIYTVRYCIYSIYSIYRYIQYSTLRYNTGISVEYNRKVTNEHTGAELN